MAAAAILNLLLSLACFWIYYVSCACVVESCVCQLYCKRIYDM